MPRYVRRVSRIGHSLGPSEERGFELWVGYDIDVALDRAEELGLVSVEDWPDERLVELGVTTFRPATLDEVLRWRR